MQNLQRVDGVHHLLVDLCHHRGEHLHGEIPGETTFHRILETKIFYRSVSTRRMEVVSTTRSSRIKRCDNVDDNDDDDHDDDDDDDDDDTRCA